MKKIALCIALAAPCAAFAQSPTETDITAAIAAEEAAYLRYTAAKRTALLGFVFAVDRAREEIRQVLDQVLGADDAAAKRAAEAEAAAAAAAKRHAEALADAAKRHAEVLAAIAALPKAAALTPEQIAAMLRVAPVVP